MKVVELSGGAGVVLDDGDPPLAKSVVFVGDDEQARAAAAAAVVEKTNATLFATELAKVKAKAVSAVADDPAVREVTKEPKP